MKLKISLSQNVVWIAVIIFLLSGFSYAQGLWSPTQRQYNGDLVSVFFTSRERGWIGGDAGYFAFTNDGGATWTKQNLTTTENVNEIYFRNDDNGYLLVGRRIFISNDGGKSWRENRIVSGNDFKNLTPEFLSVRFSGKKKGWIVGSLSNKADEVVDSLVLQTLDSGETWTRIIVPTKKEIYHVDFVNDENGWLVGDEGIILRTQDTGQTWSKQASNSKVSLYNVDFRDEKNGVIVGGGGTILRTEDGGQNWVKIRSEATKSLLRVNFVNDKLGWIVGGSGMVLRTEDKGKTWVRQNSQLTESLYGLYMDKRGGWAVGKKGIILKYTR